MCSSFIAKPALKMPKLQIPALPQVKTRFGLHKLGPFPSAGTLVCTIHFFLIDKTRSPMRMSCAHGHIHWVRQVIVPLVLGQCNDAS